MKYKIYPVFLGEGCPKMDISQWYYRRKPGNVISWGFGCFILEGEDREKILVNTGAPSAAESHLLGFETYPSETAPTFTNALKNTGVTPEKIHTIILTDLRREHIWNLDLFPNARIYIQDAEIRYAVLPPGEEFLLYGIGKEGPRWLQSLPNFHAVKGDMELNPGLKLIKTAGHTPGGQSVLVDTEDGLYALTGNFSGSREGILEEIPDGQFTSVLEWYRGCEKLRLTGAKIITERELSSYTKKYYG